METTKFGKVLVEEMERLLAERIAEQNCDNKSNSLKKLWSEYAKITGKTAYGQAWCAMTASVILNRASERYVGQKSKLLSASSTGLLNEAKAIEMRIDSVPAVGAVALSTSNSAPSGYHTQMVWKIDGDYIFTCEGNGDAQNSYQIGSSGCLVKANNKCSLHSRKKHRSKFKYFIHTEEMWGDTQLLAFNESTAQSGLADGSLVASASSTSSLTGVGADYCVYSPETDIDGIEKDGSDVVETDVEPTFLGIPRSYAIIGAAGLSLALLVFLNRK
jgi:hypothetical protein